MILNKLAALLSFIVLVICSCNEHKNAEPKIVRREYKEHYGEKFVLDNILDTAGKPVSLDFSKSDITIIDFWNSDCPPCIEEMRRFSTMIAGKENKVSVFSITLDQYPVFKKTFNKLSFMKDNQLPNWKLLALTTSDDPDFGNTMAMDRLEELAKKYSVTSFPTYFVVNKEGIIQARPESAVEYIGLMRL